MYTRLVAYTVILEDDPDIDSDLNDDNVDGDEAMDEEDTPNWEFDVNEKCSLDPMYKFCPAAHHKQLLLLVTCHFCHHPFFPTRNGTHQILTQIHEQSVCEMYVFCKTRGLTEVWAYMWSSWYSLSMWKL